MAQAPVPPAAHEDAATTNIDPPAEPNPQDTAPDTSAQDVNPQEPEPEPMQETVQEAPKVSDEAVHEVPALTEESAKHALEAAAAAVSTPPMTSDQQQMSHSTQGNEHMQPSDQQPNPDNVPGAEPGATNGAENAPVSEPLASSMPASNSQIAMQVNVPLVAVTDVPLSTGMSAGVLSGTPLKEEDAGVVHRASDDIPLVEVAEAMLAANDVFNRVKSEKIAEQALCSIRNDQAQYEGLAKEIVGKAIKQKERERANRASAAASRAKVIRYQTELESRLNRMEAERNAYRREVQDIRCQTEGGRKMLPEELKQLTKMKEWIRKMEVANPQFVRSVIAQGEIDDLLGEPGMMEEKMEVDEVKDEENSAKRRRV